MVNVGNKTVQPVKKTGLGPLQKIVPIVLLKLGLISGSVPTPVVAQDQDLADAKGKKVDIESLEVGQIYVDKERLVRRTSNDELVEYIPTNNSKIFFANDGENAYIAHMDDKKAVRSTNIRSCLDEIGFKSDEPIDYNKVKIFTLKEDKYYVAQFEGKKGMFVFKVPSVSQDTEISMEILFSAEPLSESGIERQVDDGKDLVIVNGKSVFILTDQGDFCAWYMNDEINSDTEVKVSEPREYDGVVYYFVKFNDGEEGERYYVFNPKEGKKLKLSDSQVKELDLSLSMR